ncbi:MAG TPA: hypothetical protein VME17_13320 [Bryobacteraceae bacterium]|nr:hypothetical protein [Bryobacteraceae bacterium]
MSFSLLPFFFAVLSLAKLPFAVDATQDVSSQFPGAPHIQSFSFAQWQGRWVFIGGRAAGYHNAGGGPAEFLRSDSNRDIWVVDTTVTPARTYHLPVAQLPASLAPVKDQWTSTGLLYYQDGPSLYICGGYGEDHNGKWVTYPLISKVEVPQLIESVMHGRAPSAITFAESKLVQSTGGELVKLTDGYFYLVMGHSFQGSYTTFEGQGEHDAASASQTYLDEIRKLKIASDAKGRLEVRLVKAYRDEDEFHRRDLNVTEILSPAGLGIAVYGGVFTPKTQLSYGKPIYMLDGSGPQVDANFEQKLNTYVCPTLVMYDKSAQTMYTTFFGGISRYSWDPAVRDFRENPKIGTKTEYVYLDGMQWSDQISTIRKVMAPGGETTEIAEASSLPAYIGTDAVFIPAPDLKRAADGTAILDFDALRGAKTFVGYIYGGIQAFPYSFPYLKTSQPYNAGAVPSRPSEKILKVYVQVDR